MDLKKGKQALYVYLHPSFSGKLLSFVAVGLPNQTGPSEKRH